MNPSDQHPLVSTIRPLLDAIGATAVEPAAALPSDISLEANGEIVAAVRLPQLHGALDRMIESVESEIGGRLADMSARTNSAREAPR